MNEQQNTTIHQQIVGSIQFSKTSPDNQENVHNSETSEDKQEDTQNSETSTAKKQKKTTSQRLAELEATRARLIAKRRKEDTHNKIVMGSIFINFLKKNWETDEEGFFEFTSGLASASEKLGISKKDMMIFNQIIENIKPHPKLE